MEPQKGHVQIVYLSHGLDLLTRGHDLLSRDHELLCCSHDIISWPRIIKSFQRLIISLPRVNKSWPWLNKSWERIDMSRERMNTPWPRVNCRLPIGRINSWSRTNTDLLLARITVHKTVLQGPTISFYLLLFSQNLIRLSHSRTFYS